MCKHTHAGVCAGFSAAVDTAERRRGDHRRKRKELEEVERGVGVRRDRQIEGETEKG